jgi:hypothetical protein
MINEATVRELASYKGVPTVTTVYLDVDGRSRPTVAECARAFASLGDSLTRRARVTGDDGVQRSVDADLARMGEWLNEHLDRSAARGVAMFSCSESGFFEAIELGHPIGDHASLGPSPRVTELLAMIDEHQPFLVALVDRRRLRLLQFDLDGMTEQVSVTDMEPRGVDTSIEVGSFERFDEEAERAHYRRAAAAVDEAVRGRPERLIVGGSGDDIGMLERALHHTTRARIVGRVVLPVRAHVPQIVDAVLAVEERAERSHEAELITELRERAGAHRAAVVGLEPTLAALTQRRVWMLLVCEGFATPGFQCQACGWAGTSETCPTCGLPAASVDDVIELAVEEAVAQGANVEFCRESTLDHFGSIGAIERY